MRIIFFLILALVHLNTFGFLVKNKSLENTNKDTICIVTNSDGDMAVIRRKGTKIDEDITYLLTTRTTSNEATLTIVDTIVMEYDSIVPSVIWFQVEKKTAIILDLLTLEVRLLKNKRQKNMQILIKREKNKLFLPDKWLDYPVSIFVDSYSSKENQYISMTTFLSFEDIKLEKNKDNILLLFPTIKLYSSIKNDSPLTWECW